MTDARDGPDGREYRVRWFVWAQGERAPLGKRLEWRRYDDFVNRALADAFDDGLRAEAGVAEDESDDDVDLLAFAGGRAARFGSGSGPKLGPRQRAGPPSGRIFPFFNLY